MLMCISILSALLERSRTGKEGRRTCRSPMQDAQLNYIRGAFIMHARTGHPAKRNGSRGAFGGPPPAAIYPTKGGGPNDWIYVFNSHNNPLDHWRLAMQDHRPPRARRRPIANTSITRQSRKAPRTQVNEIVAAFTGPPRARQARGDAPDRRRRQFPPVR